MIDLELPGAPDLDDDAERERWRIHSDREAAWAIRKLATAVAEHERIKQNAADEIDAIRAWQDAALAGPARDAAFFEGALVRYRLELEEANPALPKTYKIPGGVITRRKQPDVYRITAEAAFIAWALAEHPELVHIEARVAGLRDFRRGDQLVDEDGQHIPGVELVVRDDTYSAKPG
jgi:hypothetical protein